MKILRLIKKVLTQYMNGPLVNSLDVPGIFARSFYDLSMYLNILKGQTDHLDSTSVTIESSDDCSQNFEKPEVVKQLVIGIPQVWSFQEKDAKLERFLAEKDQRTLEFRIDDGSE